MPKLPSFSKYARLALDLREFLSRTVTLEESRQVLSTRLQNREQSFLNLLQKGVYGNPKSPYLRLLEIAGCEFGDVQGLVARDGLESALRSLADSGAYLSWEEFKGKREVVRAGSSFRFAEKDFDNPFLDSYYHVRSSGTRSAGTRTLFDLRHRADISFYYLPSLAVIGALDAPIGLWLPALPSSAGISGLLHNWNVGKPVLKWFTPVTDSDVKASLQDRLALKYIIYGGRLCGARLAKPEYVSVADALTIARWVAETKRQYGSCALCCFVSLMVRVCQAATENGLDIEGTVFFGGGEPLTEAKRRQIEAAGARVNPRYWITEIGLVGCGCPEGSAADDVHLFTDSVAVVQRERRIEHAGISVNAFFFTSLLPSAPKILLNVESDDYGVLETRACGCLFGELGFTQHLYNIRSFAKLTGSGMTIMGSEFLRILEEVLPQRYGGAPTDYQLLEEEDERGQTSLSLAVSPELGPIDEKSIVDTVLDELRRTAYGGRLAAGFWAQVDTLAVRRIRPLSSSGKIATLHLLKSHNGAEKTRR